MNKESLKIAAVQMVSSNVFDENIENAVKFVTEAAKAGANLIVLPEYFAIMANKEVDKFEYVEKHGEGRVQRIFSDLAKQLSVWLVVGSHPIMATELERPYGRCYVYNSFGDLVVWYDKIHLFDVTVNDDKNRYCESKFTTAGSSVTSFDTPWGKVGLAICYDLRFPELFRELQQQGCEILVLPAAFTYETGRVHWEILLRARAIENLCYIVAAAQGGTHANHRQTWGHSCIISPWGELLQELATGPGYVIQELNRDAQLKLRKEFPVLTHKKL